MDAEIPFDAITTFFVFLIGLPAIVFQWLAPEIRQVVVKRSGELLLDSGIPVAVAFLLVAAGLTAVHVTTWPSQWIWTGTLGAMLFMAGTTGFRIPRKYARRAAVVKRIEREAYKDVEKGGSLREGALQDLVDLGKLSPPGREKELVLESLQVLAERYCERSSYRGDGLEDVTLGVLDVILGSTYPPTLQNYETATEVLKRIAHGADPQPGKTYMEADLLHAVHGLSRLGRGAVLATYAAVVMSILQVLSTTVRRRPESAMAISQALFEVGLAAVARHQMLVAMSCAETLTSLAETALSTRRELVADALGLLAHFWTSGETGRLYARPRVERIVESLDLEPINALQMAAHHCAQTTQFETADKVWRVAREVG